MVFSKTYIETAYGYTSETYGSPYVLHFLQETWFYSIDNQIIRVVGSPVLIKDESFM